MMRLKMFQTMEILPLMGTLVSGQQILVHNGQLRPYLPLLCPVRQRIQDGILYKLVLDTLVSAVHPTRLGEALTVIELSNDLQQHCLACWRSATGSAIFLLLPIWVCPSIFVIT